MSTKRKIAHKIRHYTLEEIKKDYRKLAEIGCLAKNQTVFNRTGNKVVDQFTFEERLNTVGREGLSFFDVWNRRKTYRRKPYVRKFIENSYPGLPKETVWYNLARFYFGAVQIFKPLIAMEYYCQYRPTCILDPTMGWGGRLVAAHAIGVPKYIGIDQNVRLKRPYRLLTRFLEDQAKEMKHSTTETELLFQDALTVDYSKYKYDMVFTSPPYYNIEKYSGQQDNDWTKEKWDREFYQPLFEKTWKYLDSRGYYIINIPIEIYDRVAKPVLGPCLSKKPLKKKERLTEKGDDYVEYIYVWQK